MIDDTYKDNNRVELLLRGLATAHPHITELLEVGRSHQGRTIWGLRVFDKSNTKSRPAVLFNGGHHGDELLAVDYAVDALQDLLIHRQKAPQKRWISELDIVFVPLVNPDGNHHTLFRSCKNNIGRKNGRDLNLDGRFSSGEGVDLNRNYPFKWGFLGEVGSKSKPTHHHYRGTRPASEPETKAMMSLSDRFKFVAAFSWHTNGRLILTPYTIRKVRNLRPDLPKKAAKYLRRSLSGPNAHGFRVQKDMYPVDGVDQDWHLHHNGTLAYIIEGSHHNPQDLAVRRKSVAMIRPLYGALLDYVLDTPRLTGFVTDLNGDPIAATVMVREVRTFEGEAWKSRVSDGRFDRFVPPRNRYRVEVEMPGYAAQTLVVPKASIHKPLRVVLRPDLAGGSD